MPLSLLSNATVANPQSSTVAIIGAGPVGLAAAAQAVLRGLQPIIFEAGSAAGASVSEWGHVQMFSPWRYNVDKAAMQLLVAAGWQQPDLDRLPTGHELVAQYLIPLSQLPAIKRRLHFGARVVGVGREGIDKIRSEDRHHRPFILHVEGRDGNPLRYRATAVIDASGTWTTPNPMGAGGLPALGEREASQRVAYGIPDVLGGNRNQYVGRRTLVMGSGHSAMNVLLDLSRLKAEEPATQVIWASRRADPTGSHTGPDSDLLPARGALGMRVRELVASGILGVVPSFETVAIYLDEEGMRVLGQQHGIARRIRTDLTVVATGFRPDHSFLREVRLELDSTLESVATLAPLIDPNVYNCGDVRLHGEHELRHPEIGFYIAGVKSYGRAPSFLLKTGYEQVRSIIAALAGDREAAERKEFALQARSACSSEWDPDSAASCCA